MFWGHLEVNIGPLALFLHFGQDRERNPSLRHGSWEAVVVVINWAPGAKDCPREGFLVVLEVTRLFRGSHRQKE